LSTNREGGVPHLEAAGGPLPTTPTDPYREIFEAVALPVLMIDAETWRVIAVNEAAVRAYGYTREEFVGLAALQVRPPEGRTDAYRVLSQMPHGFWKASAVRHQRKDGSIFSVDVWSRDTVVEGRAVRIATVSDVTERVELQHELQQAQKMEAVGRLAGGIAHDFNNALTAILASAELLEDAVASDPDAAGDLADIRAAAERAASLTARLLAFGRRQVLRVEDVSLDDVLARVEPLLRRTLGEHIELRVGAAATWSVRVDPGQMEQVVLNLAVNARDAMPGGGTLTLATKNASRARTSTGEGITVPAGDYVELTVQDTGVGMDAITRTRVFEPFFTTKPPPEGTGLGLSMVHGIVRQSGGFTSVESSPGEGNPAPSEPSVEAESGPRPRVLVVEEEDVLRGITCRVLEGMGYEVLATANGEEALAWIARDRPPLDLLVTDLFMSHVGGRELATELGRVYPELRVLYVSGYSGEAAGQLGLLGNGTGYLRKPFSIEALGEAVRRVLQEG
jgi:PAS domain S-box-containing protein